MTAPRIGSSDVAGGAAAAPPAPPRATTPAAMPPETFGLDVRLWRRIAAIAAPYWRGEERWRAAGLLALLVLLLLGQTGFAVLFNHETGEFTSALAARDAPRFWRSMRNYALVLAFAVPVYALYYYVRDTLGLRWRRWLTHEFLSRYFSRRAYYRLNAVAGIDNPDQRISEDIAAFTQQSLFIAMVVLAAVTELVAFAGVLWSISRPLVLFLGGYAVLSTWFTVSSFGKRLIGLNFRQLQREADFRFQLVRVREHAEPIAFHNGEAREMSTLRSVFDAVYANYRRVLLWQLKLNTFQYAHGFLTVALPVAFIAGEVLSGALEVGRAIQASGAFAAILGALTVVVQHFEGLSRFAAGVNRLHSFSGELQRQARDAEAESAGGTGRIRHVAGSQLELRELTVLTPGREHLLIRDVSLQVPPGEGLLIAGPSGCGKSSLLRAIAGLWTCGGGELVRPADDELQFLPQRAYLPPGGLRTQLLYPRTERTISDAELLDALAAVKLAALAERLGGLDVEIDWNKLLSVGEQQRLAFARALLARPRYLLLDEATSALDPANEDALYGRLAALSITPVSVSHHASLEKYHRRVLELEGEGRWRLRAAQPGR